MAKPSHQAVFRIFFKRNDLLHIRPHTLDHLAMIYEREQGDTRVLCQGRQGVGIEKVPHGLAAGNDEQDVGFGAHFRSPFIRSTLFEGINSQFLLRQCLRVTAARWDTPRFSSI